MSAKFQDILPEVEHNNVALDFDQKIGDGPWQYLRRCDLCAPHLPPRAVQQVTGPVEVPTTQCLLRGAAGRRSLAVFHPRQARRIAEQVNYFFGNDLGNNAYSIGHSENYQGALGIDIKLAQQWHLGFDGTAGKDHDRDQQNQELNNGNLAAALASGNPTTALNVFGGSNTQAVLNSVFDSRFYASGRHRRTSLRRQTGRPTVSHARRRCASGGGGQWRHDELLYGINSGVPGGGDLVVRETIGSHVVSGYAEVLLPFFGAKCDAGVTAPGARRGRPL